MARPWVPKRDPATLIFVWATLNTNFSINTEAPNLNSTGDGEVGEERVQNFLFSINVNIFENYNKGVGKRYGKCQ